MCIEKIIVRKITILNNVFYGNVSKSTFGIVLFAILLGSCGYYRPLIMCNEPVMSQKEAIEIGNQKFKKFFESDGIMVSEISQPELSSMTDIPWIMDYKSGKRDKFGYFVRVTIDSCGAIETSGESW
jgi:hypothetical protein